MNKLLLRKTQCRGFRGTQRKLEVQQFENLPYTSKREDFGILPPLLVRQPPIALVDCGSGSTRALFFQDDGKSHVTWEKSAWRGLASDGPAAIPRANVAPNSDSELLCLPDRR